MSDELERIPKMSSSLRTLRTTGDDVAKQLPYTTTACERSATACRYDLNDSRAWPPMQRCRTSAVAPPTWSSGRRCRTNATLGSSRRNVRAVTRPCSVTRSLCICTPGYAQWRHWRGRGNKYFFVAEFRQTTSEGGSCDERTTKKSSLCRGRWLKRSSVFWGQNRWHRQLPARVRSTLVTPLTTPMRAIRCTAKNDPRHTAPEMYRSWSEMAHHPGAVHETERLPVFCRPVQISAVLSEGRSPVPCSQ